MEPVSPPPGYDQIHRESSEDSHASPNDTRMWTCSPVQFETQPLERSRGLIPGTLLLLHKADGSYSLLWEPSISAGTDYHVEFPLRRIVTLRRSKGPRVAFVLTKGGSVGPFLFPGEDQYERLLRKLVELNVIDPDSLSKPVTTGDWLTSGFANLYGAVRQQVRQLIRDDTVDNRPTFLPPPDASVARNPLETDASDSADVVCRRTEDMGELGDFEVFDMANALPPRESCTRESPVSLPEFRSFFRDGKLVKEVDLRRRVFKGGFAPEARAEGWMFFLGFNPNDEAYVSRATADYAHICQQWQALLPAQIENNKQLREQLSIIEKDVERTDRTHPVFVDTEGQGLRALSNILTSWIFYNWDVGYVQGMSDLAAMLYVVLEDEVAAFWCFVHWMQKLASNFDDTQSGIIVQLAHLSRLIRYLDPELMAHLEEQHSDHFFFCFRWLIVLFKREFEYTDTMTLWEATWSEYLSAGFPIFICVAIILSERESILAEKMRYDDILKAFNELSLKLDVGRVLCDAESIFYQLRGCNEQDLPPSLRGLLQMWTERYDVTSSQLHDGDDDDDDDDDDEDDDDDDDEENDDDVHVHVHDDEHDDEGDDDDQALEEEATLVQDNAVKGKPQESEEASLTSPPTQQQHSASDDPATARAERSSTGQPSDKNKR